jgi:hypothetical protein
MVVAVLINKKTYTSSTEKVTATLQFFKVRGQVSPQTPWFTALYMFSGGNAEVSEAERETAVKEFLARVKQ